MNDISEGRLYAPSGSPTKPIASALGWLWRLGPVLGKPDPQAVGLGDREEESELRSLVAEGKLAGAAIFRGGPGPVQGEGVVQREIEGTANFSGGGRVDGRFTVFDGNSGVSCSTVGNHAVRQESILLLGAVPDDWWGRLGGFWVLESLMEFLPGVLERPLVLLPPVGVARIDDVPGTALQQVRGTAKGDRAQARLSAAISRAFARHDACLNVAVPAEALMDGERVALDRVWPRAVAGLRAGVEGGAIEPVCHGLLHLVPEALAEGRVDFLEFSQLDREEARRRLEIAAPWQERVLGMKPPTFVAPAWGYSDGALRAAADLGLPAWLPPMAGPLLEAGNVRETLDPALSGLHAFDFRPLSRFAASGLPPTVVFHGRSLDPRPQGFLPPRDPVMLARLALKRDIYRVPGIEGVKWLGAGDYVDLLEAHERIRVRGASVEISGASKALLYDGWGLRPASGS